MSKKVTLTLPDPVYSSLKMQADTLGIPVPTYINTKLFAMAGENVAAPTSKTKKLSPKEEKGKRIRDLMKKHGWTLENGWNIHGNQIVEKILENITDFEIFLGECPEYLNSEENTGVPHGWYEYSAGAPVKPWINAFADLPR